MIDVENDAVDTCPAVRRRDRNGHGGARRREVNGRKNCGNERRRAGVRRRAADHREAGCQP